MNIFETMALFSEIQQMSHIGIWRWKVGARAGHVSDELLRIYCIPDRAHASIARFLRRLHRVDRAVVRETIEQAVAGGKAFNCVHRVVLPDGMIRYVSLEGRPSGTQSDGPEYVGIASDITERKLTENALVSTQIALSRALSQSTTGELAAAIAHEISQPLTAILTNSETCLRLLTRVDPSIQSVHRTVWRIARDAERATKVVEGLRSLAAKTGLTKTSVNIDDTIREALAILRHELESNAVVTTFMLNSGRLVLCNRVGLQQVLLNLARNAVEAMSSVSENSRFLHISSAPAENDTVAIVVRDTGAGFSPELAERMFEALFTTKDSGMGLGLSVSRSIIEAHGGRLCAWSNRGEGTHFRFTIPYFPENGDV